MPRQRHYYGLNHLHFITASTYRRARLFDSERFRSHYVQTLGELRQQFFTNANARDGQNAVAATCENAGWRRAAALR